MKNTQFKVEDIFGNIIKEQTISPEQITKLITFFSQNDVNRNINSKPNFFKPGKEIDKFKPSAQPD